MYFICCYYCCLSLTDYIFRKLEREGLVVMPFKAFCQPAVLLPAGMPYIMKPGNGYLDCQ